MQQDWEICNGTTIALVVGCKQAEGTPAAESHRALYEVMRAFRVGLAMLEPLPP